MSTPARDAIQWSDFAVRKTIDTQQTTFHQAASHGEELVTLLGTVGAYLKNSGDDAKFDAIRNAVKNLVEACHRLDVHHNALSQLQYQATGETTNFKDILSSKTNQIDETIGYDVNSDPLLAKFDQDSGAAALEDDIIDDEIAIAGNSTQQVSRNERCPITGKPVMELEEPVVDKMNFVYEKTAILQMIKNKRFIKCPVAGTMHDVTAAELKPASRLIAEKKKLARHGGKNAKKQVPEVSSPGLLHQYWECPIAVAIRNELWNQLSGVEGFTPTTIHRHHLWLLEPPPATFFKSLWPIIALAALNGMDSGRRTLFRLTHKRISTPTLVASSRKAAIRNAIATFWKLLAQFAATPQSSNLWSSLAEDHPFLHWNSSLSKLELTERQHPP